MNILPPNFDQNLSRSQVCLAFQSDSTVAAHAATVLYFKLIELSQQNQLLQGQLNSLSKVKAVEAEQSETTIELFPLPKANLN